MTNLKFDDNPYYSPEKCGLQIFEYIDTAGSYEFDIFCIWEKLDTGDLYYDSDSGCSCPSPFDNGDHGHDLKLITGDTYYNFKKELENHYNISVEDIMKIDNKVRNHLEL